MPGVDPQGRAGARCAARLPHDVKVLTRRRCSTREIGYWARATPIGFVFTFGVIMGLVVGMIIVYQILFADVSDHLKEYATLKAMGYTQALPARASSWWRRRSSARSASSRGSRSATCSTRSPAGDDAAHDDRARAGGPVLGLTLVMCWVSALIAMRKLRAADPADVF